MQQTSLPRSFDRLNWNRLVPGLRAHSHASDCFVFRMNEDGSKGGLLRIEPPVYTFKKIKRGY